MPWSRSEGRSATERSPWKFRHIPGRPGGASSGGVVIVHGLFLFGFVFLPLAWRLAREGYDVYVCDYPTRRFGIREHGAHFARLLDEIAGLRGAAAGALHIVTHSLGGIVARVALASLEGTAPGGSFKSLTPAMIGRTVMLAPPNKGSHVARDISRAFPWSGRFAKPLPELSSAPGSEIHSIPVPKSFQIGIVAGTFDIEVALPLTELEGVSARSVLCSDHTFMPFYPHVYRELLHFLRHGSFISRRN